VARAEPPDPQANLPQSYENPWGLLGRDLRAVTADLGLQLRALWRRNRQGEFSAPGFWPGSLLPLFWPLLVALLLIVVLALPWITWKVLPRGPGPGEQGPREPRSVEQGGALAPGSENPLARSFAAMDPSTILAPLAALPAEDASIQLPELEVAVRESPGGALPAPVAPEQAMAPPLALDPLLQMLADADPEHLIVSAHPEPALSLLRLTLAPAFAELPAANRHPWADRWCERARELGYERFELIDDQQRLLGRQALVGSGMILLDPVPRL
jgi:hypothetical protein